MLGRIAGAVRFKEPLSFHTSLRIGGPVEFFIAPQQVDDVRYALAFAEQEDLPVIVIGGGNNLLVSDRGIQAVVLKLQGIFGRAEFDGNEVVVGAGVSLSELIREAAARELGGLEHLVGIPATIGGALASNAGTRDGSLAELCTAVSFMHADGTPGEFRALDYRPSRASIDLPPAAILVGCRLRLVRRTADEIRKDIRQHLRVRKASQPFALASAGYIWKNPASTPAERLIAGAGLRGKRVNTAEISVKCSNLIVNRGGATAGDVLALMDMTRDRVAAKFGITLRPAIRMLGLAETAADPEPSLLATAG
jgi:UDP-N-acetylmuramate dehydrogenase